MAGTLERADGVLVRVSTKDPAVKGNLLRDGVVRLRLLWASLGVEPEGRKGTECHRGAGDGQSLYQTRRVFTSDCGGHSWKKTGLVSVTFQDEEPEGRGLP